MNLNRKFRILFNGENTDYCLGFTENEHSRKKNFELRKVKQERDFSDISDSYRNEFQDYNLLVCDAL